MGSNRMACSEHFVSDGHAQQTRTDGNPHLEHMHRFVKIGSIWADINGQQNLAPTVQRISEDVGDLRIQCNIHKHMPLMTIIY